MKKFSCEVTTTSVYEIEIDEDALGDEFLAHFKKHFADFDDWSEHAAYIAERKSLGDQFIEGYGEPLVNGKNQRWDGDESSTEKAININIVYENDVDVDCSELS